MVTTFGTRTLRSEVTVHMSSGLSKSFPIKQIKLQIKRDRLLVSFNGYSNGFYMTLCLLHFLTMIRDYGVQYNK